ncbi:hypothetical protein [Actinoplanes sp. NPDC051859]|uniref:hypothetical protein n=1 Tax=Actinoplanes sp. NPDC051859 TaxID=3363909 RepID=UPI00378BC21E
MSDRDGPFPAAGQTAPVFVPAPRAPEPYLGAPPTPPAAPEWPQYPTPTPRRSRRWIAGVLALVAVLAIGGRAFYNLVQSGYSDTSADTVLAYLDEQAEALLRGDEQGWLELVDPGSPPLVARYQAMFTSLRALGVREFHVNVPEVVPQGQNSVLAQVDIDYCLTGDACASDPTWENMADASQRITLTRRDGDMVITSAESTKDDNAAMPAPWEVSKLFALHGKRLTLVASAGQRSHLPRLLPIAERAATVADRYAGMIDNPQRHYRIYVAGPQEWTTWYANPEESTSIGYAQTLTESTTDVVLNMAELESDAELLAVTIQHELAHVATIGGLFDDESAGSRMWLEEGLAEYIGWLPQRATDSSSRPAVREALDSGDRPPSIALPELAEDADLEEGDTYYGMAHFAANCLADKYGDRALMTFARLYLREATDLDRASEQAFGRPFPAVDKTCRAWTEAQA